MLVNLREIINEIRQILYPDDIKCIVCGREIHPNRYGLCDKCELIPNDNYCVRCGRHKVGIGDYCNECADMPLHFDEARSSVIYGGNAKDIVRRLKYGSAPYLARFISEYMIDTLYATDWDVDCFTFVPMHKTRMRKRGYNQAEKIAVAVADKTTMPCVTLLEKTTNTPNQARLNKEERIKNVFGTYTAITRPPDRVVIIDDVMTTGSTLNECARVLKEAGAKSVYALTFASVPERPLTDREPVNIKDFRR